jgi:hypothetical protein
MVGVGCWAGLSDPAAEAASNVLVQKLGVPSCPKVGALGWELMPGLDRCEDDLFITSKTTFDAFYKTELLYVLLELNVRALAHMFTPLPFPIHAPILPAAKVKGGASASFASYAEVSLPFAPLSICVFVLHSMVYDYDYFLAIYSSFRDFVPLFRACDIKDSSCNDLFVDALRNTGPRLEL